MKEILKYLRKLRKPTSEDQLAAVLNMERSAVRRELEILQGHKKIVNNGGWWSISVPAKPKPAKPSQSKKTPQAKSKKPTNTSKTEKDT